MVTLLTNKPRLAAAGRVFVTSLVTIPPLLVNVELEFRNRKGKIDLTLSMFHLPI